MTKDHIHIRTLTPDQFEIIKKFMRVNENERTTVGLKLHIVHGIKQRDAAIQSQCDPGALNRSIKSAQRVATLLQQLCALPNELSTSHFTLMSQLMRLRPTKTRLGAQMVLIDHQTMAHASLCCSVARSSIAKLVKAMRANYALAKSFNPLSEDAQALFTHLPQHSNHPKTKPCNSFSHF